MGIDKPAELLLYVVVPFVELVDYNDTTLVAVC